VTQNADEYQKPDHLQAFYVAFVFSCT